MAERDQPSLARQINQLAASGDYEGFNAIIGALIRETAVDAVAVDVVRRDTEFRNKITDLCHDAWAREHPRR